MKAESGSVVTLTYDITSTEGEIIESSDLSGPVAFLLGKGAIIKGLDEQVIGMDKGEEKSFVLPPEKAFGTIEDAPKRELPRNEFPKDAQLDPGLRFEAGVGGGQKIVLEVVSANDEVVVTKMLHPLAGQTLSMSVKVVGVRAATAAETEAGRAISAPPPPPPPKK